ncbi:putative erythroid differentiation-related factor 1 [Apostichopus japonicus]|uniref:Putative erythroid differentiation-related factor 1 n=1 Tax=Stichopus japonicus TaxID=307972 RepID=A0A2G8KLF6_STIJA|nr:putative erythroid differentiation-related factor 1 [Apostichopus japonicus]
MASFSAINAITETTDCPDDQSGNKGMIEEEGSEKVNSTTTYVLKSAQTQIPLTFSKLKQDTDLRQPPSNWLKSGIQIDGRNSWVKGGPGEFSSFRMANQKPDQVGEVDVISASENIKKLLKIPFSSNQVSMAVHRVENTLLLDELDLLKELRYTSESARDWVKECLLRRVLQDGQTLTTEKKTNQMLQNQNLLSKFLYHSMEEQNVESIQREQEQGRSVIPLVPPEVQKAESSEFARQVLWEFEDICMMIGSDLPIFGEGKYPAVSLRLRDTNSPINVLTGMDYWLDNLMCNVPELVMCYHLNGFVQKYEMLKTEEIPHLENAKFSTKVRRMISQLYNLDLTSLCDKYPNCPWDNPFIVPVALLLYRVAKNMSAMNPTKKQNAVISKLLKECVKLLRESGDTHPEISSSAYYMLTLIHINDKYDSPTKVPAGQKKALSPTNSSGSEEEEVIMPKVKCHELMSPCLQPQEKVNTGIKSPKRNEKASEKNETVLDYIVKSPLHPSRRQIHICFFFILAGLKYIHASSPSSSKFLCHRLSKSDTKRRRELSLLIYRPQNQRRPQSSKDEESSNESQSMHSKGSSSSDLRPRLALVPSELFGRKHDILGTVKSSDVTSERTTETRREDSDNLDTALVASDQSSDALSVVGVSPHTVQLKPALLQIDHEQATDLKHFPNDSWQMDVQVSLLCQAAQVYMKMTEEEFSKQRYGAALLYSRIGLMCDAIKSHFPLKDPNLKEQRLLAHQFWMLAGDSLVMMAQDTSNFEQHLEAFEDISDNHRIIQEATEKVLLDSSSWEVELSKEKEISLRSSLKCYNSALRNDQGQSPSFLVTVARKIGNVKNELGVHIMSKASQCYKQREGNEVLKEERDLWKQSLSCFEKGMEAFEEVKDEANIALLLCNSGRLMRLCAQSHAHQGSAGVAGQLSQSEKHFFQKAFKYYKQALSRLVKRKNNPQIWDAVSWELCTSQYSLGCLLQDYPPMQTTAQEEVEREIQDCFSNALRLCNAEDRSTASRPLYQYRMASIHHRLASMYHNIYRSQDRHLEVLRIQLERIAVLEFQLAGQTGQSARAKSFNLILQLLIASKESLIALQSRCSSAETKNAVQETQSREKLPQTDSPKEEEAFDSEEQTELSKLVPLMESRIKVNLLAVMKHLSHNKGMQEAEPFKKMYGIFLGRTHSVEESDEVNADRIRTLLEIVNKIEALVRSHPLT